MELPKLRLGVTMNLSKKSIIISLKWYGMEGKHIPRFIRCIFAKSSFHRAWLLTYSGVYFSRLEHKERQRYMEKVLASYGVETNEICVEEPPIDANADIDVVVEEKLYVTPSYENMATPPEMEEIPSDFYDDGY
jgi:hypothetical protein